MIYQYFDFVKLKGYFDYRRKQQNKYWMYRPLTRFAQSFLQQSGDKAVIT